MIGVRKKEDIFFELFAESAGKVVTVGEAFMDLVTNYENVAEKVGRIKEMETECDVLVHKVLKKINSSFITPLDREDIYAITKEIDDIVDSLEEVANRFLIFEVKTMRPEAVAMAKIIMQSIIELEILFQNLSKIKKGDIIMEKIIEVNRLENEGDLVYRNALHKLFKEEKDPIELIKWKHIYEHLEESLDSCENVANMAEGVVMKYA
jgi:predicted phosphate transport protein (TIGR00153 family)